MDEIFFDTYDRFVPVNEPSLDQCYISSSYDATTHFETVVEDVLAMYTAITGKVLDLSLDVSAAIAADEYFFLPSLFMGDIQFITEPNCNIFFSTYVKTSQIFWCLA